MSEARIAEGRIAVIGGGHAAAQLRRSGAARARARVHLVCDEAELPYQRPPLSKPI